MSDASSSSSDEDDTVGASESTAHAQAPRDERKRQKKDKKDKKDKKEKKKKEKKEKKEKHKHKKAKRDDPAELAAARALVESSMQPIAEADYFLRTASGGRGVPPRLAAARGATNRAQAPPACSGLPSLARAVRPRHLEAGKRVQPGAAQPKGLWSPLPSRLTLQATNRFGRVRHQGVPAVALGGAEDLSRRDPRGGGAQPLPQVRRQVVRRAALLVPDSSHQTPPACVTAPPDNTVPATLSRATAPAHATTAPPRHYRATTAPLPRHYRASNAPLPRHGPPARLPGGCTLQRRCTLLQRHCTYYLLLTAHCSLLTAHCSLLTAHCSLLTVHCSLRTPYYALGMQRSCRQSTT